MLPKRSRGVSSMKKTVIYAGDRFKENQKDQNDQKRKGKLLTGDFKKKKRERRAEIISDMGKMFLMLMVLLIFLTGLGTWVYCLATVFEYIFE